MTEISAVDILASETLASRMNPGVRPFGAPIKKQFQKQKILTNPFSVGDLILVPSGTPFTRPDFIRNGSERTSHFQSVLVLMVKGGADWGYGGGSMPTITYEDDLGNFRFIDVIEGMFHLNQKPLDYLLDLRYPIYLKESFDNSSLTL